jgi:hypothetical protein
LIGVTPVQSELSHQDIVNINYNKTLEETITEEYKQFEPFWRIIVRCELKESKIENGIYMPAKVEVPVKTANEMAFKEYQDSPYPYTTSAVVVAVPKGFTKYKPGDWIVLDRNVILATKQNINAKFHLPFGFTMPSWTEFNPPRNPESPHYGYLILDPSKQTHGLNNIKNKVTNED